MSLEERHAKDCASRRAIQHMRYTGRSAATWVIVPRSMAERTHRMRLDFPDGAPPVTLDAVVRSTRSRPDYLIQADLGKNARATIGLSGSWGQHVHAPVESGGVPNLVRMPELGPEHTASGRFGL